jgi:hypothetical protein
MKELILEKNLSNVIYVRKHSPKTVVYAHQRTHSGEKAFECDKRKERLL